MLAAREGQRHKLDFGLTAFAQSASLPSRTFAALIEEKGHCPFKSAPEGALCIAPAEQSDRGFGQPEIVLVAEAGTEHRALVTGG